MYRFCGLSSALHCQKEVLILSATKVKSVWKISFQIFTEFQLQYIILKIKSAQKMSMTSWIELIFFSDQWFDFCCILI